MKNTSDSREVTKVSQLKVGQKLLGRRDVEDKFDQVEVTRIGDTHVQIKFPNGTVGALYDDVEGPRRIGAFLHFPECPSNECAIREKCTGHLNCTGERKVQSVLEPVANERERHDHYVPAGVNQVVMQLTLESPRSVSDWAVTTFGDTGSNASCAARQQGDGRAPDGARQ